ncbi:MAG: 1-acyl-sn-glycerol-3-phosphate acyltransferase [Chitinivibrionales bacterium]|nr:1-acyl-sn-glycerol-3-phosphate acyltransferase [Chitinivibrionales bacterium]
MMRTILWYTYFWICLTLSIVMYGVFLLIKWIFGSATADRFVTIFLKVWARHIVLTTGSRITIHGLEHLPHHNNICFIANHQGYFDIPLIIGFIPKPVGFIAKHELLFIPFLGLWINAFIVS